MSDGRYKTVQSFTMPSEYERAAAEARRRRRMAELLALQEYDPSTVQNAPIPAAAPLVQGLQAYLKARAGRKAEEALEKAEAADVAEFENLYKSIRPQERAVTGPDAFADPMEMASKYTAPRMETYTPSEEERRTLLERSVFGKGSPRAKRYAETLLAEMDKKPESKLMEFGGQLLNVSGGTATPVTMGGKALTAPAKPLLTPNELADLRLKYGTAAVDRALGVSGLSPDVQSNIPALPSFESLLSPLPATASGGLTTDLETGAYTPGRGLQYRNQATTASGQPVSGEQRPTIERVSPKEYGALVAKQPTDKRSAQNALGQISMMRNFIQDLQQHGGTDYIFGPIASITPDIRGSATSARSLFDTLRERSSTEALKQSRAEGFAPGSITEAEWPRFETAIGAIRGAKDPRAMRVALENADAQLRDIERRILTNYQGTYGPKFPIDYSPPPYKPESSLYPTPKVQTDDKTVFDEADRLILEMQQRRARRGK